MSNMITSEQLMYFQNILEQAEYNSTGAYNHYWVNNKDNYMGKHIYAESIEHSNLFLIKSKIAEVSGGSCWDRSSKARAEHVDIVLDLQDYFIIDKLIKQHFSHITLMDYTSICNLYEKRKEEDHEYYGNYQTYQIIEVDTKVLLQKLQDIGCDVSIKSLEALSSYYTKEPSKEKKLKM